MHPAPHPVMIYTPTGRKGTVELTQRQADITRTVAAAIDNAANQRCEYRDSAELIVREDDRMYVVDVTRTILLNLVMMADRHGLGEHSKVITAGQFLRVRRPPEPAPHADEIDLHLEAIHDAAHFICAITFAVIGEERSREYAREIVHRFAVGNYGRDVTVVDE